MTEKFKRQGMLILRDELIFAEMGGGMLTTDCDIAVTALNSHHALLAERAEMLRVMALAASALRTFDSTVVAMALVQLRAALKQAGREI